jgi:hypothetical protein
MTDGSAIVIDYYDSDHLTIAPHDLLEHICDEFADDEDVIQRVIDNLTDAIARAIRR